MMKHKIFIFLFLLATPLFALDAKMGEKELIESAVLAYQTGDFAKCRANFNKAVAVASTSDTVLMAKVYDAKITLEENPMSPSAATQVSDSLLQISSEVRASKLKGLSDSYYSVLMHSYAIVQSWSEVLDTYDSVKNPDEFCVYLKALAYYKLDNFNKAEQFLVQNLYASGKRSFEKSELALLYANILGWQKKYEASKEIYERFYVLEQFDDKDYLDFAKILYNLCDYKKALEVSQKSKAPQVQYFCGLCYLNLEQYKEAFDSFAAYSSKNQKGEFYELSSFYKAYSSYKLGKYKEAYSLFDDFAASTTDLSLARQAYELLARSAVLCSNFEMAGKWAENLVKICFNEEEKQKALIFCAQIYADNQNVTKAISTLQPYTNEKSDFALECLFTMAQIYEKSFKNDEADEIYNQIVNSYSGKELAEEAMYKRGQLAYTQNNYSTAAKHFALYISKYPYSKHIEEAFYLCGECYLRCKDYDNSIRYSKTLVTKYPSSVYLYGANKNLFQAYYEQGQYTQAQTTAKFLMNNFNSQAVKDGIPYQLKVLNSMSDGKSIAIAEKLAEYEKYGEAGTKNGRLAGYELLDLYIKEGENQAALKLARLLYNTKASRDSDENEGMGKVIVFLTPYYESDEQPSMYIKAAEYFKKSGNDTNAASSLYMAVEAFVEIGKNADARETALTLKKLYPESRQAKNVDVLLK